MVVFINSFTVIIFLQQLSNRADYHYNKRQPDDANYPYGNGRNIVTQAINTSLWKTRCNIIGLRFALVG